MHALNERVEEEAVEEEAVEEEAVEHEPVETEAVEEEGLGRILARSWCVTRREVRAARVRGACII